ncbi:MAG: hypothetical protein ACR2P5_09330 [Gammaproteobacteria bacterium]
MLEIEWWHWMALGFGLLVLDIVLLNTYYVIWFGFGAFSAAAALAVFPSMPPWMQLMLFSLASAALLLLWKKLGLRPQAAMRRARRELPGQAGIIVNYNEREKRGTLRLQKPVGGKDVWEFTAGQARPGERAVVDYIDDSGTVVLAAPPREQN